MTALTWHVGDTRTVLATLPAAPFLALRSYLPADDPAKPFEMGSEPTPGAFIDALLDVVEACARVLAPHGSMCFELGDTYSGSGGAGGDYAADGLREGQPTFKANTTRYTYGAKDGGRVDAGPSDTQVRNGGGAGWPLAKSLCMIPELFRVALVYGFNPLTGRTTPRWRARNVIRWVRPNPPVGALGDKWRPATSEMVVICKASDRYFDQDATRTVPVSTYEPHETNGGTTTAAVDGEHTHGNVIRSTGRVVASNPAGAPLLDWWKISPKGYAGSHYATFPAALCIPPIRAMCPERVCTTCGKPSRRIVDTSYVDAAGRPAPGVSWSSGMPGGKGAHSLKTATRTTTTTTTGWTDCGHNAWRPGVVLDPFAGSGTVLDAALGQNRDAIGVDLDARNLHLAQDRLGMFPLNGVDHLTTEAPA